MSATHCYIGIWPECGCIRAGTIDDLEYAKHTATFIAGLVRDGYVVERRLIEELRKVSFKCQRGAECPNPNNKSKVAV